MARRKQFGPALPPGMKKARAAARRAMKAAPKTQSEQVALIKSVIAKSEETKFRSEVTHLLIPHNGQILTSDVIRVLPKLVQGQGQAAIYEREGMRVSPRKLRVDMDVSLFDTDRSTAIVVCYWMLQAKNVKNVSLLPANLIIGSDFLKTGDANNTQGFNGYYQDSVLPVNDARYTVLKRGKFLLAKQPGAIQDQTSIGLQPLGGQPIQHRVSFDLKTPKTFVYDQDEGSPRTVYYPNGYAPFLVVGYFHQNQTAPDIDNTDVNVTVRSSLWFDDA